MPRRPLAVLLVAIALAGATMTGCSDDDTGGEPGSTTTTADPGPSGTSDDGTEPDASLEPRLLTAADLPPGFSAANEVDDTITSFCATHDAASGLQASSRAVAAFSRDGGGASVIQLVFRFRDDGAATFVAQAEAALVACSGVPDGSGTGLAFEYEPLSPDVEAAFVDAGESRTGGYGTSVGSGSLTVEIAVLQSGDVGTLVAVLGLDEPRADLDGLAATAFAAVASRL